MEAIRRLRDSRRACRSSSAVRLQTRHVLRDELRSVATLELTSTAAEGRFYGGGSRAHIPPLECGSAPLKLRNKVPSREGAPQRQAPGHDLAVLRWPRTANTKKPGSV